MGNWKLETNGIETPKGVYVPKEGTDFKTAIQEAMSYGGLQEANLVLDNHVVADDSEIKTPTASAKVTRPSDKAGR